MSILSRLEINDIELQQPNSGIRSNEPNNKTEKNQISMLKKVMGLNQEIEESEETGEYS